MFELVCVSSEFEHTKLVKDHFKEEQKTKLERK